MLSIDCQCGMRNIVQAEDFPSLTSLMTVPEFHSDTLERMIILQSELDRPAYAVIFIYK